MINIICNLQVCKSCRRLSFYSHTLKTCTTFWYISKPQSVFFPCKTTENTKNSAVKHDHQKISKFRIIRISKHVTLGDSVPQCMQTSHPRSNTIIVCPQRWPAFTSDPTHWGILLWKFPFALFGAFALQTPCADKPRQPFRASLQVVELDVSTCVAAAMALFCSGSCPRKCPWPHGRC